MAGAETFRVGLRIDRYELTKLVAEGGFGVIYVARDVNLGRELAIKFLLPQHNSNPDIVNRFVQEARTLARVVHPGIVTVYEAGTVQGTGTKADGTAFILMELLDGETLTQRLKRTGPMPATTAMEICRQVANALAAAHQLGMIHRDLKPDNIVLVKDPAIMIGERAKVLDFGIAKNSSSGPASNATQIGMVFGTPAYMSPEQCRSSTDVTPASDVYSLGCILFELLVGRTPFLGAGMGELFMHHLMTEPPAPSSLLPMLPRHLDEVIGAMLAKDPARRPATMQVVERILDDARLVGKPQRTRTLGGAMMLPPGSVLPLSKPGMQVEMGPARPLTPAMGVPQTTERGHATPVSTPAQPHPTPAPMTPIHAVGSTTARGPGVGADAATLLNHAAPPMPSLEEAQAMMRKREATSPQAQQHGPAVTPQSHDAAATMIAPQPTPMPMAVQQAPRQAPSGSSPPISAAPHKPPTTISTAVGVTTQPPTKKGSRLWIVGAVLGAIAIAVVIIVVGGSGGGGDSGTVQPSGSDPKGSSEIKTGSDGSAKKGSAEVKNGSAEVKNGSAEVKNGSAGSAEVKNGSAEPKNGSAELKNGSDGSAEVKNGSAEPKNGSAEIKNGSAEPKNGSAEVKSGSADPKNGSAEIKNGSADPKNGSAEIKNGSAQPKNGSAEIKNGSAEPKNGSAEIKNGSAQPKNGSAEIKNGSAQPKNGSAEIKNGSAQPKNGSAQPKNGSAEIKNGSAQPKNGSAQPKNGSAEIKNGSGAKHPDPKDPKQGSGAKCLPPKCIEDSGKY